MGSADLRTERNQLAAPLDRLRYDLPYFEKGVLAGKKAHTNEHIQADCVLAILELAAKLDRTTEILQRLVPDRNQTITQGATLAQRLDALEAMVKRLEGRMTVILANNC